MSRKITNEVADVINTGENVQGVPLPKPSEVAAMNERTGWTEGDPSRTPAAPLAPPEEKPRPFGGEPPDRTRR